jgi:hypothetical protein
MYFAGVQEIFLFLFAEKTIQREDASIHICLTRERTCLCTSKLTTRVVQLAMSQTVMCPVLLIGKLTT